MRHQHADGEADGVDIRRIQPAEDVREELLTSGAEQLGRHHIAGRPVVHKGEKPVELRDEPVEIADGLQKKGVQIVFFVIGVRQLAEKILRLRRFGKLLRQSAQLRRAHADDAVFGDGGDEFGVKIVVSAVLQGKKTGLNRCHAGYSPP